MFGNHLGTGCENNNPGIDCVNRRYSTAKNTVYQAFISLGKTGSLMKCIRIYLIIKIASLFMLTEEIENHAFETMNPAGCS